MSSETTVVLAHTVSPDRSAALHTELTQRLPDGTVLDAVLPAETDELVSRADMLVVGRLEESWLEASDSLQLLQTLWAGVDLYPIDSIEESEIAMANAAGVHARPIAEQVLGYMLTFERRLLDAVDNHGRGVWESLSGGELGSKTVGIIGVGAIGSRVAALASAFGMETLGTKRDLSTVPDDIDKIFPADEYHELLTRSDYVVVACPLTDETEGLLGSDEFRLLDSDAVLINVARGGIVEQDDLVRALQYGLIDGAALDVFDEEPLPPDSLLWDLSNVIVTPHMAWTSTETTRRWADVIEQNYRAVASNDTESIVNRVI
jgi:phosphoglycerate dehydrogenase-like enzyme